ncbi:MAG: hypothetical protein LBI60_01550 [Bacteroidales bacterium]|jgi:hypothetical protein|nr:hypothetical protein [Bacteroidales bacterium]
MFIKRITKYEYPDGMPIYKITQTVVYFCGIPIYQSIKKPCAKAIDMIHAKKIDLELIS